MNVRDLLTPARVVLDARARDKTQALQEIARLAATADGPGRDAILTALQAREALGSTGLGEGFALPHARMEGLPALRGFFVRLARPVAFDAIDGKPVDLLFLLLMPAAQEKQHLAALAAVARHLRVADVRDRLRAAKSPADAFAALCEPDNPAG